MKTILNCILVLALLSGFVLVGTHAQQPPRESDGHSAYAPTKMEWLITLARSSELVMKTFMSTFRSTPAKKTRFLRVLSIPRAVTNAL